MIGPRYLDKPNSIIATIGYIKNQWSEMGYEIEEESYNVAGDTATNLIVETDGQKRAGQTVLLTDTSYLRNPNYHQATDTPPGTLDYPRMTEVTISVAAAMKRLLK